MLNILQQRGVGFFSAQWVNGDLNRVTGASPAQGCGCPLHFRIARRKSRVIIGGNGPLQMSAECGWGLQLDVRQRFRRAATFGWERIGDLSNFQVLYGGAQYHMSDAVPADIAFRTVTESERGHKSRPAFGNTPQITVAKTEMGKRVIVHFHHKVVVTRTTAHEIGARNPV